MIRRQRIKDVELIKMIMSGDQEINKAIEYILYRYSDKITTYLMKQNCSKEDAEDVLYEGLSIFMMNVRGEKFQGESSVNTYLTAICKRIWFRKFNKKMLHIKWERSETKGLEEVVEESILSKELSQGLEILMNNLKEKCKEVLKLWSLSYSLEEIKNKLGYSNPQVVANKKNLCLKELRKQLNENPGLKDLII
jgi:RNA polymerase sigma factor (sigma-70 family)